jgi:hypothetical protein
MFLFPCFWSPLLFFKFISERKTISTFKSKKSVFKKTFTSLPLKYFSTLSTFTTLIMEKESLNEFLTRESSQNDIYGVFTWNNFYLQVQSVELAQQILKNEKTFQKFTSPYEGKFFYKFLGPKRIVNVSGEVWKNQRKII